MLLTSQLVHTVLYQLRFSAHSLVPEDLHRKFVFPISQILEPRECVVQRLLIHQNNAQFVQARLKGRTTRMFAEHHLVGMPPHIFGTHYFVSFTVL